MARKAGMSTGVEVARISVKVSPDTKNFRSELKTELEAIERSMKGDLEVKAHLDTGQALADFRRLLAQMRAEAAKGVVIKVKTAVDDGSGSGDPNQESKKALAAASKSSKKWMQAPSFGTGINPAGYAVILAGVVALAAPLLGLITTALLSLPGLIALVATPIAALTLGIKGFTKAAEVLKQPFEELQSLMTTKVQEQFTPVFESLKAIFPTLKASLPAVTQGLADMFQGFSDAVTRPENVAKIEETIRNIGRALSDAKPGVDDFVSGFIELARGLSETFPGLTEWFNGAGKDFREWVNGLDLKTAFEGLGSTIKVVLDLLGDLGKTGMEWIQDPSKVNDFKDGLTDLANILRDIATLSSNLTNVFKNMLPSFNWDGIKEDLLKPFTSEDAGWRKIDEFINGGPAKGETAAQIDAVTKSLTEAEAAAATAGAEVGAVIGSTPEGGAVPVPEPVTPPNLEPAKAEITEYQGFVDDVTQQVRGALSQATSGETLPAPNFEAFKAAWNELPNVVRSATDSLRGTATQAVQSVVEVFNSGGALIALTVASWPGQVKAALEPLATAGSEIAARMVQGMVAGINAGVGSVTAAARSLAAQAAAAAKAELGIKSPSRVFMGIGDMSAKGYAVGLENGFQPVLDQARAMAGKVAEAFANGSDPTGGIAGYSKQDLTRMEKVLALETKRLESQAKALDYQAKTTGNEALKARAAELRQQKEQLSLQKDMLGLTKDYNSEVGGSEDPLVKAASGLMNSPIDFAKATGKQFLTDLGISGDGFISKAITEGISYVFNIGSVDEALSIKDRQESKQALSIAGR